MVDGLPESTFLGLAPRATFLARTLIAGHIPLRPVQLSSLLGTTKQRSALIYDILRHCHLNIIYFTVYQDYP